MCWTIPFSACTLEPAGEVAVPKKYRATLFTNGGSQAVRLPKECRFDGKAVEVWREGSRVIIEPVEKRAWSPGFWESLRRMAPDVNMEVPERLPANPYRDSVLDELAND
jgi:antitoxin VapB